MCSNALQWPFERSHAVHEDLPDQVSQVIVTFLTRNRLSTAKGDFTPVFPGCWNSYVITPLSNFALFTLFYQHTLSIPWARSYMRYVLNSVNIQAPGYNAASSARHLFKFQRHGRPPVIPSPKDCCCLMCITVSSIELCSTFLVAIKRNLNEALVLS